MAPRSLVDRDQRRLGLIADIAREGVDVDVADALLDLPFDGTELDPLADHAHVEGLVAAWADDRQLDRRARFAAQLGHGLIELQSVNQLTVDVSDVVAGLDPRLPRRRVLGRGDDLHRAVLDRDGETQPAVIAFGRRLELVEIGRFDIA